MNNKNFTFGKRLLQSKNILRTKDYYENSKFQDKGNKVSNRVTPSMLNTYASLGTFVEESFDELCYGGSVDGEFNCWGEIA